MGTGGVALARVLQFAERDFDRAPLRADRFLGRGPPAPLAPAAPAVGELGLEIDGGNWACLFHGPDPEPDSFGPAAFQGCASQTPAGKRGFSFQLQTILPGPRGFSADAVSALSTVSIFAAPPSMLGHVLEVLTKFTDWVSLTFEPKCLGIECAHQR